MPKLQNEKTAAAIAEYFDRQRGYRKANADNYMKMAKVVGATREEIKYAEDRAWVEGVKMVCVLNDMEADIIRIIKS